MTPAKLCLSNRLNDNKRLRLITYKSFFKHCTKRTPFYYFLYILMETTMRIFSKFLDADGKFDFTKHIKFSNFEK